MKRYIAVILLLGLVFVSGCYEKKDKNNPYGEGMTCALTHESELRIYDLSVCHQNFCNGKNMTSLTNLTEYNCRGALEYGCRPSFLVNDCIDYHREIWCLDYNNEIRQFMFDREVC